MPTYLVCRWHHDHEGEPVVIYEELDDDRVELRKVQEYADGRLSRAHTINDGPVLDANKLATLGYLAIHVLQDPVVRNAWRQAAGDCSITIGSVATARSEIAASWRRHGSTAPLSSD